MEAANMVFMQAWLFFLTKEQKYYLQSMLNSLYITRQVNHVPPSLEMYLLLARHLHKY